MLMYSGPHHTNIGKRELRQMLTAVARLCGQPPIGPSGVSSQRNSRTRAAISLWLTEARRVVKGFDPSGRVSMRDVVERLSSFGRARGGGLRSLESWHPEPARRTLRGCTGNKS